MTAEIEQQRKKVLYATVKLAAEKGLSVWPPEQDGSKKPNGSQWKDRQTTPATTDELRSIYKDKTITGVGIICGKVSGNLENMDFDENDIYKVFRLRAIEAGLGTLIERMEKGYLEYTPNGVHLLYRCTEISGNTKLATRPKRPEEMKDEHDKTKTLIETRGEGGYVIIAPTFGTVNPAGTYNLISGSIETIPTITPEERRDLHDLSRTFHVALEEDVIKNRVRIHRESSKASGRPGDDFNERATWEEVLKPHGWQLVFKRGTVEYWRRPGKSKGISATIGHNETDLFHCFTSSSQFESDRSYTKFTAFAVLNDQGDFQAAAKELARQGYGTQQTAAATKDDDNPYFIDAEGYLCRYKKLNEGVVPVRIANFAAQIIDEISEDDGIEIKTYYGIEGDIKNKKLPRVEVAASQFPSMNWLSTWGSACIIEPGQSTKDYLRHAIQVRSNGIKRQDVFTHSGWRKINGEWVYLTAGGAVGVRNVSVRLPKELEYISLPHVPENEIEAIEVSLLFLEIAPHSITFPLYSFLYLAPLTTLLTPMPNYSQYIHGGTGVLKTTISEVALSHFGNTAGIALSNFEDTANSAEKRACALKDMLHVIDDYCPSYKKADAQQKEHVAQRLIRSYSNRTGRHRLRSDTTERGAYIPRGLLLVTGEELPQLQSTNARISVISLSQGDIDRSRLTQLQQQSKLLPHAMSSYINWLREHISEIQKTFPENFRRLREKAFKEGHHAKLPEQTAFYQFSWEIVLSWLADKNIVTENQAKDMSHDGWTIFIELAEKQSKRIDREDPVRRFREIIHTLIAQGRIRMLGKDNITDIMGSDNADIHGYFDDLYLYFLPTALWNTIQRYCISEGSHFPFGKQTFYRMLKNRKLIAAGKESTTKEESIHGKTKRVLKINRAFFEDDAEKQ